MPTLAKIFRRLRAAPIRATRNRHRRQTLGGESLETRRMLAVAPAPAAPLVALSSDTGSSVIDRITSVGTLSVTGTLSGAVIGYSINGGKTWDAAFAARPGPNTVLVRQTLAGVTSAPRTFSFTLDTTAPAAPRVALQRDTGASATDRLTSVGTLATSGTEVGATVQYSVDAGKTWRPTFTSVEGKNTLQVRQIDVAGNVSAASPFEFTRQSTAPIVESMTFDRVTRRATLVFSRPVTGVSVDDFRISGTTSGFTFDLRANDGQLIPYIGSVVVSGSGRTWTLTLAKLPSQQSGTYALTLVGANSGIVDDAGNALVANRSTSLVL